MMSDAILLAQFYLFEAKRLAEAATISMEIEAAERLRLWILDSWPKVAQSQDRDPQTIVPRDVVISGPNALRETATVKKLMGVLAAHGWLYQLPAGEVIGGQARQVAYKIGVAT